MHAPPVAAVFDVGKTNKKLFLFDEQYRMVYEEKVQLPEVADEDGFPCEDVQALTQWIQQSFEQLQSDKRFQIRAVNVSAYGASFVHVDKTGHPLTPLYNYLKPYPEALQQQLYERYGGAEVLSRQTASPVLGSLNSGLQLYRIKWEQPQVFQNIRYALHLPQYVRFIISNTTATDITSVGCHTLLWDFEKDAYHRWVAEEGLLPKFAPLRFHEKDIHIFDKSKSCAIGIGLHDSSAALIPYLALFQEPFLLLSTGTWCISLNPFNDTLLTGDELKQDCLCYLTYEGKPVKAARLFAGYEHEQQVKKLAAHYNKAVDYYKTIHCDIAMLKRLRAAPQLQKHGSDGTSKEYWFSEKDLTLYDSYEEAYHRFMLDLMAQQVASTELVLKGTDVKRIFVDGGFSKNDVYMHLLAAAFPHIEVYAASIAQATALGAALVIHHAWNKEPLPHDMIALKRYSPVPDI